MSSQQGIVIKSVGGVFTVLNAQGNKIVCFAPKKFRFAEKDIIVGDKVLFDSLHRGKGVVTDVLPRKNKLTRPEIANVDLCFVVLAHEPQPDFYLADKVLINCFHQGIEPVVVVNKTDVESPLLNVVQANYGSIADIVAVSALDDTVQRLAPYLQGKTVCFAGQSAVGKTSLLNALLPSTNGEVGGISAKSGRGMHTTRHSSLHQVFGGFLADTCGFSLCDIVDIRPEELRLYLDDFVTVARGCKFTSCTHTAEPDCAVKKAVEEGAICKQRYERYVEEYNQLLEQQKNQY